MKIIINHEDFKKFLEIPKDSKDSKNYCISISKVENNEEFLEKIIELLNNSYFSDLLETKYKHRYLKIQKKVKKLKGIELSSLRAKKLLVDIYSKLKYIWLSEKKLDSFSIKIFPEKSQNLFESKGTTIPKRNLNDLHLGIQSVCIESFSSVFYNFEKVNNFFVKFEFSFKNLKKEILYFPINVNSYLCFKFSIVKKLFSLEKIRGRSPSNLFIVL